MRICLDGRMAQWSESLNSRHRNGYSLACVFCFEVSRILRSFVARVVVLDIEEWKEQQKLERRPWSQDFICQQERQTQEHLRWVGRKLMPTLQCHWSIVSSGSEQSSEVVGTSHYAAEWQHFTVLCTYLGVCLDSLDIPVRFPVCRLPI